MNEHPHNENPSNGNPSNENPNESQRSLPEQLMRLQWLLARYHHHIHRAHGPMANPHYGQGRVLKLLKMQPEITQKELSFLLDMRPQSLGELLAKLERGGYITRTPSESDKRVMNIRLTEQGAEAASQDAPQPGDVFAECFTDEEQAQLGKYLERIIAALEAQFGESLDGDEWHHEHGHEHGRRPFGYGPGDGRGRGYGRGYGPVDSRGRGPGGPEDRRRCAMPDYRFDSKGHDFI